MVGDSESGGETAATAAQAHLALSLSLFSLSDSVLPLRSSAVASAPIRSAHMSCRVMWLEILAADRLKIMAAGAQGMQLTLVYGAQALPSLPPLRPSTYDGRSSQPD